MNKIQVLALKYHSKSGAERSSGQADSGLGLGKTVSNTNFFAVRFILAGCTQPGRAPLGTS